MPEIHFVESFSTKKNGRKLQSVKKINPMLHKIAFIFLVFAFDNFSRFRYPITQVCYPQILFLRNSLSYKN